MPSFGGLLKRRRTRHSKDLPGPPTGSSGASSLSTPAPPASPPNNNNHIHPLPPSSAASNQPYSSHSTNNYSSSQHHHHHHPSHQSAASLPVAQPTSASSTPTSASRVYTAPASTTATTAAIIPNSPSAGQMSAHPSPHLPPPPPESTTPLISSPQHHHRHQNVASIKNIINPPHNDELPSRLPGDSQFVPQQQQQQTHLLHQGQQVVGGGAGGQQPARRQLKGKYSLEDFSLRRTLGTGSFGRVHLVQSRHNQRFYAMKVLKKQQVVKMKQVEHTNDERSMLERVKHPFLVTLWGTFQDPKNLYMVMDFVEGGELFSLLRKSQRFPNPVAKFYAAEVTLALEYLHSQHIVYRDLKPENLLLDRHGHLKITDFGFAKEVKDITWTLCGTPDYLAPEVVSSKGYNKSVDWWSLGILIYEMLCGFTPFWDSGSPMKIYENILHGRVRYPPHMHVDAQDLLSQLITPDLTKRLGNLHGGPEDVKNHPWFAEVTWDRLANKDIDAPYIPPIKAGQGDASQFDSYPEETEKYGIEAEDPYGYLFVDF